MVIRDKTIRIQKPGPARKKIDENKRVLGCGCSLLNCKKGLMLVYSNLSDTLIGSKIFPDTILLLLLAVISFDEIQST